VAKSSSFDLRQFVKKGSVKRECSNEHVDQAIPGGNAILTLTVSIFLPASSAPPADWSAVPVKTVTLFYPGQGGYQWLRCTVKNRRPTEAGLI
jgi:hypothetical protein